MRRSLGILGLGLGLVLLLGLPASAQTYVGVPPPRVGATTGHPTTPAVPGGVRAATQQGASTVRASGGFLALTGSDLVGMSLIAVACLGVGFCLVRVRRSADGHTAA